MKHLIAVTAATLGLAALGAGRAEAQWDEHYAPPPPPANVQPYPNVNVNAGWKSEVAASAHRLADQAIHMAEMLRTIDGYSHLTDDAMNLAGQAEHFHVSVESEQSPTHALQDFRVVRGSWIHFRDEFRVAHQAHHIAHLQDDWAALSNAYVNAAHTLDMAVRSYGHHGNGYYDNGHGSYDNRQGYYQPPRRYGTPQVRVRVYPSNPRTTYYDPRTGQYYYR